MYTNFQKAISILNNFKAEDCRKCEVKLHNCDICDLHRAISTATELLCMAKSYERLLKDIEDDDKGESYV